MPWRSPAQPCENAIRGGANLIAGIWLAYWDATIDLFLPLALTLGVVVGCAFLARVGTHLLRDPWACGQQRD